MTWIALNWIVFLEQSYHMVSEDLEMKSTTSPFDLCIASQIIYSCGACHFGALQPLVTIYFHFMKKI